MQNNGLVYIGDDYSYFAHATSLAFGQFPSYKKEFFTDGDTMPKHSIGPGLMAAPFVYIFSLLDRIGKSSIILQRTRENSLTSWSLFGFVFATNVYFWIACFLLYRGLRNYFSKRHASLSIILMVLFQGLPLYVFRRPVFSHAYEFFLQSLMIYILLRACKSGYFDSRVYWKLIGIGIIMGLTALVRLNNIPVALFWPLIFLGIIRRDAKSVHIWRMLIIPYAVLLVLLFCFKVFPEIYNHSRGYGTEPQSYLFKLYSASFYLKRFMHMLFGADWGLIFTAPFMLIGLITLFCYRFPLRRLLLICLIPIAVNLYCSITMKTQGGWYGYRYLVTSLIPIAVYPFTLALQNLDVAYSKKTSILLTIIAIFPLLSMLSFEGNNSNLTLTVTDLNFSKVCWGNNAYQLEVWKTLLFTPLASLIAIFKGGLLYLIYLVSIFFGFKKYLPGVALEKYVIFDLSVLIKTIIIYLLPFTLLLLYKACGREKFK